MGLKKNITLPNGVMLRYHRIAVLTQHVNMATIIEVQGYTSQAKRTEEREAVSANAEAGEAVVDYDAYIETTFHNLPYDPEMTVEGAYEYLKTLPEYEGATDE